MVDRIGRARRGWLVEAINVSVRGISLSVRVTPDRIIRGKVDIGATFHARLLSRLVRLPPTPQAWWTGIVENSSSLLRAGVFRGDDRSIMTLAPCEHTLECRSVNPH